MPTLPGIVGVGVDLGSSATTVSTRRSDDRPQTRHVDRGVRAATDDDVLAEAIRAAGRDRTSVALAVPADWASTRRRAHAEAAANAGFEVDAVVPEPEAAARFLAEARGERPDPGSPLVVCAIGAGSCNVGVARHEGDRYRIEAATSTDDVGGKAFDGLLLDHLAARHRAADPEFWQRASDPAESALRTAVLAEIRRAREHLTDHPSVAVRLPGLGRELRLSREEAEQCLIPAILRAVAMIEGAMLETGIGVDERADLLLVGGASRTPLIATVIRHHLGVEPVLPAMPELVVAEGAALAALGRIGDAGASEPPRPSRLETSPGVLVTALVVGVSVAAIAGVALMNRDPGDDVGTDAVTGDVGPESYPSGADESDPGPTGEPADSPSASASPNEDSGGTGEAEPSPSDPAATSTTPAAATPATPAADQEPTTAAVPEVVGASLAEAERILAEAGFTDVAVEGERRTGNSHEHCETTAQTPEGGSRASYGDRITVTYVYVGEDNC
jgi:actin-like ATPase involved in cell morphogenesis